MGFICLLAGLAGSVCPSQRTWSSCAPPDDSWRHLQMTLERPAEGSFRAVPESISCLTRTHALLTNPTPGQRHAPPGHVLHGRHPHESGESFRKNGSRQVDLPREGSHSPGFLGMAMDQRERTPNVRITQCPEPAETAVLVAFQPCSDGLDNPASSIVRLLKPTTSTGQGQ